MKSLLVLVAISALDLHAADQYASFTRILRANVHEGRVNYAGLKQNRDFAAFVDSLSKTNPALLSTRAEQMAFWINVYNAFTLKLIADNYPVKSINELHSAPGLALAVLTGRTVWKRWTFTIHGEAFTLDRVEHDILRSIYRDFRIHAAINCASKGCPPLRAEAYEPSRLDEQLDEQMRIFLGASRLDTGVLYVSKIFDWFRSDFETKEPLAAALRPYLPPEIAARVHAKTKIEFIDYDWSLNE